MRYLSLIILLILISYSAFPQDLKSAPSPRKAPFTIDTAGLSSKQKKIIKDHEIYAKSEVKDYKKKSFHLGPVISGESEVQSLNFKLSGIHKRSCRYALNKISLYEKYKDYFPGHNPVPMNKVVNAYVRSVGGKDNGAIIRFYEN